MRIPLQWKTGRRLRSRSWIAAAVIAAGIQAASLHAQPRLGGYSANEYAVLHDPGASTVIRQINSAAEVAGGFRVNPRKASSALIFMRGGIEVVAGNPGVDHGVAFGLNDQGEVVGAFNGATALRPYRAVRRVGFEELPLLAGDSGGAAYAINLSGESVGYSSGPGGTRAVWWPRGGSVQALPRPSGVMTRAFAINNAGDVVGIAGSEVRRGVLWPNKGAPVELGTLADFIHSEAVAISERGEIAGVATGVAGNTNRSRAVLWDTGGRVIRDLGTLPGDVASRARDINARGEVVGTSVAPNGASRAFIWTAATGILDLNVVVPLQGLVMSDALGVSSRGHIVVVAHEVHAHASGTDDGHQHEQPRRLIVLAPTP